MNFHYRSSLQDHYAAVRERLRAPVVGAPVLLLPYIHPSAPAVVLDPVPDQRGKLVMPIGPAAEIVAARRALAGFARLRRAAPSDNSVRHLQSAVAAAFKVDLDAVLARTRRPGPTRIRQIAMMLAMRCCTASRNEVGRRFDRNHATVFHAERKLNNMIEGAASTIGAARS